MVGLILKFEGRLRNIVKELLIDIDISNLEFDISHWESYGDDIDDSQFDFNNMEDIPSELIRNKLLIEDHYICPEFMELFIGKFGSAKKEIYYYKDFMESDYEISIISYDYRNVEIISKDESLLKKMKDNFLRLNLDNKRIKELDDIALDSVLQAWRSETMKSIED